MTLPKPPYPWDITLEEELRQFELLKPRLESVWNSMKLMPPNAAAY